MNQEMEFTKVQFGDTEFEVPIRYTRLVARGIGAQGIVW